MAGLFSAVSLIISRNRADERGQAAIGGCSCAEEFMPPSTVSYSIRLQITRLRRSAIVCCWIVGLALACQALIWSLASYTQIRNAADRAAESVAEAPAIVKSEPQTPARGRILTPVESTEEPPAATATEAPAPGPNRTDQRLGATFDVAGGIGRIAMIVLLVVLGLGVVLAANATLQGGERAVLAFVWAALVAVLVLPLGGALHLPWEDGALSRYAHMTSWVDRIEANRTAALAGEPIDDAAPSTLLSHARFLLLPLACIIGVVLIGLRFSVAVESAVLRRESLKLDPVLEREAANISPTSLHGPRGASVVNRTIAPDLDPEPVAATKDAGDAPPKRLI